MMEKNKNSFYSRKEMEENESDSFRWPLPQDWNVLVPFLRHKKQKTLC